MKYLGQRIDYKYPKGAAALTPAGGVSWRIVNNTVTTMIGGIAAVILELAEPRVRAGVWNHSTFREKPLERMIRTGKATMITVYAPAAQAQRMIQGVNNIHARVTGTLEDTRPYSATDPLLVDWVQATANFGFMAAYDYFAKKLSGPAKDAAFSESAPAGRLFGASASPETFGDWETYLDSMRPYLFPSDILQDFLTLARTALPLPKSTASLIVNAAVDILPHDLQQQLGLERFSLSESGTKSVKRLARLADRIIPGTPCAQSLRRMNLKTLAPLSHWEYGAE